MILWVYLTGTKGKACMMKEWVFDLFETYRVAYLAWLCPVQKHVDILLKSYSIPTNRDGTYRPESLSNNGNKVYGRKETINQGKDQQAAGNGTITVEYRDGISGLL